MNTYEFLQISAAVVPDREAIVEAGGHGRRVLYMDFVTQVNKLANALTGLGLERGHKLAVMSVNSADYLTTFYAASKLGVTVVPLNNRAKVEELIYMLNTSEAKALLVSDR